MAIEFRCPSCSKLLRTPDESAGKKAKCPQCGGIADVPLATGGEQPFGGSRSDGTGIGGATSRMGQPLPPLPPGVLSGTGGGASPPKPPVSPFGAASPTNPYASPAPDFSAPFAQGAQGNLVPSKVSFDAVVNGVWAIFRPQLGQMVVLGLVLAGVNIALQVIGQVGSAASQASGEPAIFVIFTILNTIMGIVVQTWLSIGQAIYMLKFARNEMVNLNDLGRAGPYFVRMILMQLFLGAVGVAVMTVCLAPAGILYLITLDRNVALIAGVLGALVGVPTLAYLFYRWFLGTFFVVDCNMGVMEALSNSTRFMVGNKLTAFLILLVVGFLGGLFSVVTCCVGYLFLLPYMALTLAAIYLTATGQPWGQSSIARKTL